MEINVRDGNKIVEVWLTGEEKQDADLRDRLKSLYQECKTKNFLVAVFESGEQGLEELTGSLLDRNRKRAARLELEREKRQGEAAGGVGPCFSQKDVIQCYLQ